jgi:hypothetical protein
MTTSKLFSKESRLYFWVDLIRKMARLVCDSSVIIFYSALCQPGI